MTNSECTDSAQRYLNNGKCKSLPSSKTACQNADFLWSANSCVKSCPSGYADYKNECWEELPFSKKRWTPAEAAEWLNENDNMVTITFKK